MMTTSDGDTAPTVPPTPSTYYTTMTGAPPSVNRETSGTDSEIMGAMAGIALLLLVAMVSTVVILLCARQRRRKRPQLTDNVDYNIHDHDVKTDTN
jgi:hypothetical protein